MDSIDLPYNPANVLASEEDVLAILTQYKSDMTIRDINVYRKAFVHKSYCTRKNENFINGNTLCPVNCIPLQEEPNERLEFLGDAVVNLAVGKYLFDRYPDENEGFMTRIRTKLVNGNMLAHLGGLVDLGRFVLVSKQIEENDGRCNKKIMEDCFEAFIGAMLNDQEAYAPVEEWFINLIEANIDFAELISSNTNYKDTLMKHYQQNYNSIPRFYEMSVETLPAGGKSYKVCVKGQGEAFLGIGTGTSKKLAENDAARAALSALGALS
jgi:ribonuclease-3